MHKIKVKINNNNNLMNWALIAYIITGVLSILSHIITFQALSHRTGTYSDVGLTFGIIRTIIINILWGFTFPFFLNQHLDPNLPPIIHWILLLGGGLMHSILGVSSIGITLQLAEKRWKSSPNATKNKIIRIS